VIVAQTVPEHLRWQAEACARLGSPLYGDLLHRAAHDVEAGGVTGRGARRPPWPGAGSTASTSGGWAA